MDYNLGVIFRWRDFPWNEWVYTTLESGAGFSYTEKVLGIERQRHPDRNRNHLAFYWPIELSLAHPRYKQHRAVFFVHHRSGGRIFHQGGANSVGIAYRYAFGYR
ncbi:MAG: hypothetical protein WD490_04435 [Opitutales bacterium]